MAWRSSWHCSMAAQKLSFIPTFAIFMQSQGTTELCVFPGTFRMTSEDKSSFKRRFKPVKCWDKLLEELGVMIPYGQVMIHSEDFLTNKELICFARSLFISFIAYPLVLNTVLITKPELKSTKLELVLKSSFWLNWSFFIQNWLKLE